MPHTCDIRQKYSTELGKNLTQNISPTLDVSYVEEKKILHGQLGPLRGNSSFLAFFEPARVRPN